MIQSALQSKLSLQIRQHGVTDDPEGGIQVSLPVAVAAIFIFTLKSLWEAAEGQIWLFLKGAAIFIGAESVLAAVVLWALSMNFTQLILFAWAFAAAYIIKQSVLWVTNHRSDQYQEVSLPVYEKPGSLSDNNLLPDNSSAWIR